MVHREGFGFGSKLVVTCFDLATASPFCLLAEYGSGVQNPYANQAVGLL
jgi:hypothetical protein